MFVGKGMTDISKAVSSEFDGLTVVMYGERSLLEGLELFFKLNGSIVFIISKKGREGEPEVMSVCGFTKNHTGEVITDCAVDPRLEKVVGTVPIIGRDKGRTFRAMEDIV